MHTRLLGVLPLLVSILPLTTAATVHYVDLNSPNPTRPYTSWATAATNIQEAVLVAPPGDTVLVTNGVYQAGGLSYSGSNRVCAPYPITIQSVNGPAVTLIKGYQVPGTTNGNNAVRCAYLGNNSTLAGFTLTGGATQVYSDGSGGAVLCQSTSAVVTNCVISGNVTSYGGGGVYSGTVVNCILSDNLAGPPNNGVGGGADNSVLVNCVLTRNFAGYVGGAAFGATLINCTVVSNSAASYGGSLIGCTAKNSIIYYNTSHEFPDDRDSGPTFSDCCFGTVKDLSANVITNAPLFVDLPSGNYHLSPASPCLNIGSNAFVTASTDLDGNPRVVAGTVDLGAYEFQSSVRYVKLSNPAPVSPFTTWLTAATNIQDAIDAANAGDFVVVSNGTYQSGGRVVFGTMTNRVVVDKPITVQSLNGAASTVIAGVPGTGGYPSQGVRCVYLADGAALAGFTLTNGATRFAGDMLKEQSGGAAWCETTNVCLTNCVLAYSYASQNGGAVYQGTLNHCVLSNCTAFISGGGAYQSSLNNSLVAGNKLVQGSGGGGVAYGTVSNCVLVANFAPGYGGGAYYSALESCVLSNNVGGFGGAVSYGTVNNSLISSNAARFSGYGGGAYSSLVRNCVVKNNITSGNGAGACNSIVVNCTVVSNSTPPSAGAGGGLYGGSASNSIIYYNFSAKVPEVPNTVPMYFCCTPVSALNGEGNITNAPLFADLTGGDYHLQPTSPCINAGNTAYVIGGLDLDGNPRVRGGTVDLGAYEFQSPASALSYAWLQQYGLPTDGSADFVDSDGDGLNTWQEWVAGTDPTNAASVLALQAPAAGVSGISVTWQSVTNKAYSVQRATDLLGQPAFVTIQSHVAGQAGSTSFLDTTALGGGPFFYRVAVEQ